MENKFTDADIIKLASILKQVTNNAEFKLSLDGFIGLYNDLEWVNKTLIPKMKANIFEVKSVKQTKSTKDSK